MIETKRLILRPIDKNDDEEIVKWRNQKEIINGLFSYKGITLSEHRNWFEKYLHDGSRMEFIIIKKDNNKKIGTIGLSNIDSRNQKSEYGILLGEKEEWGKGYAVEASLAVIHYGFQELNMQKIYLKVFADNMDAINLYKRLGFIQEGLLRKDMYKNGEFKDVLIMAILRDEWKEKDEYNRN